MKHIILLALLVANAGIAAAETTAIVLCTLTRNGDPVSNATVSLARSIAGRTARVQAC